MLRLTRLKIKECRIGGSDESEASSLIGDVCASASINVFAAIGAPSANEILSTQRRREQGTLLRHPIKEKLPGAVSLKATPALRTNASRARRTRIMSAVCYHQRRQAAVGCEG
jgi:hypothetical protein